MSRHRGWFEFALLAVEPYLSDVTCRVMFVRGRGPWERESGREGEKEPERGMDGMDRGARQLFSVVFG